MSQPSVFLPRCVQGLSPERRHVRCPGTILFCDVAGFTPLTERLLALGREGAEVLTGILNGYFTKMIDLLLAEGGDVLRFGGDAMTVLFPGRGSSGALRAATRMMAAMEQFQRLETRAGTFAIAMKIGVAYGSVSIGTVGSDAVGFDYYAAGNPLDDAAEAEHRASAGEILLHPSVPVPARASIAASRGSFRLLDGIAGGSKRRAAPPEAPPDVARLLPRQLKEADALVGGHRGVAVVFVAFGPMPRSGLHRFVEEAFGAFARACGRHGGYVNKIDMGDKGAKAMLIFGAPSACERREEMALRAAKEIAAAGLPVGMGVTSSSLYAGMVGSPERREFTVMGDGVNLAARLMQAAKPGGILCDRAIAEGAGEAMVIKPLKPISVKGKREPIPIFTPLGERAIAPSRAGVKLAPERQELLASLREAVLRGPGAILSAPAGMGKSALLRELAGADLGLPVTFAELAPYHLETPYAAFRMFVRDCLGLQPEDGAEVVRQKRDDLLAHEQKRHRLLVNPLIGLEEHRSVARMDPKMRRDMTMAIVLRLLESHARLLYLDNLHSADPLSLELLERAFMEPIKCRLAVTTRQAAGSLGKQLEDHCIELPGLLTGGVRHLLAADFGVAQPSDSLIDWFMKRSGGNPAVIAATMETARTEGLLHWEGRACRIDEDRLFQAGFPETLEAMYLLQVDRLPAPLQLILRAASVLGPSVSVNLLRLLVATDDLDAGLEKLLLRGLLLEDSRGARRYVRFRDALLADALYRSLAFAVRRRHHHTIATYLEAEAAPKLWPYLAHHYEGALEEEKAATYRRLAGREAARRYDNLSVLRQLEPILAELKPEPQCVEDAFTLLDSYVALARWDDVSKLLDRLLAIEGDFSLAARSRIRNYQSQVSLVAQDWPAVERVLREGLALAKKSRDVPALARAHLNLAGRWYGPQGKLEAAVRELRAVLRLPRHPDAAICYTTAEMNLGSVARIRGKRAAAHKHFLKAYADAMRRGQLPTAALTANNTCGLSLEEGRFRSALIWGMRAIENDKRCLDRVHLAQHQVDVASALTGVGRVGEARELLLETLRLAQRFQARYAKAYILSTLAHVCWLRGEILAALDFGRRGLDAFSALQDLRGEQSLLADLLLIFLSLDSRHEAFRRRWIRDGLRGDSPVSPGLMPGLAWLRSAPQPGRFSSTPEEKLTGLLWRAETRLLEGKPPHDLMLGIAQHLAHFPHYALRVWVADLRMASGCDATAESVRLISHNMGGVFGLRLLCRIACQKRTAYWKRKCWTRLAYFRRHSPTWAYQALQRLPAVGRFMDSFPDP